MVQFISVTLILAAVIGWSNMARISAPSNIPRSASALPDSNNVWLTKPLQNNTQLSVAQLCAGTRGPGVLDIKRDFGAKGDGRTDDYESLKRAASALSGVKGKGKTLVFPPGTYHIEKVALTNDHTSSNITYQDSQDIRLVGCHAVIDVNGNYEVRADRSVGNCGTGLPCYTATGPRSIVPFDFRHCTRFQLSGFELNGNAQQTRRQNSLNGQAIYVSEVAGQQSGIVTSGCSQYRISNVRSHHWPADGFLIGVYAEADFDAVFDNITAQNNSRNGLSIIDGERIKISNSVFSQAGKSGGKYGPVNPAAGVDVESDAVRHGLVGTNLKTRDIVFEATRFSNNLYSEFVIGGNSDLAENIRLINCQFDHRTETGETNPGYAVWGLAHEFRIENSSIHTGSSEILFGCPAACAGLANYHVVLSNSIIKTTGTGISISNPAQCEITGNQLIGEHRSPLQSRITGKYMPRLEGVNTTFINNSIFIPKAAYWDSGVIWDRDISLVRVKTSSRNTWKTDLDYRASSGKYFSVIYGDFTRVIADLFPSLGFEPLVNSYGKFQPSYSK